MPKTAAQTTTDMNALPTRVVSTPDAQVIVVSLKYTNGVTWNPGALRTALATLGVVTLTDEGAPRNHGPYRFILS